LPPDCVRGRRPAKIASASGTPLFHPVDDKFLDPPGVETSGNICNNNRERGICVNSPALELTEFVAGTTFHHQYPPGRCGRHGRVDHLLRRRPADEIRLKAATQGSPQFSPPALAGDLGKASASWALLLVLP
jgi:hypothetical protein